MSRYYTKSQEWGDFDASLKAVADNPCLLNAEAKTSWVFKVTYTQKPERLLTPEQYAKMRV